MIWLCFLFFIPFGFSIFKQRKIVKIFLKYNEPYSRNISGSRICTELLTLANIHDVKILKRNSNFSNFSSSYENKIIFISKFVYDNSTISCLAVVARLIVYAAMDKKGHKLFSMFKKLMPLFNFLLIMGLSFLFIGIVFYSFGLINAGIPLFGLFLYFVYFAYLVYFLKLEKFVCVKSYELLIKGGYIINEGENILAVLEAYKFFHIAEIPIFLATLLINTKAILFKKLKF